MSRLVRLAAAAALAGSAFAVAPASADPLPCDVYTEERRFGLFGATWYGTFVVVDCE